MGGQDHLDKQVAGFCLALTPLSWLALYLIVTEIGPNRHLKETRGLTDPLMNISWSPRENEEQNFLPLSLAMNSHLMRINTPSDYSLNSLAPELIRPRQQHPVPPAASAEPDIVIVLSESFFNLNRFPQLKFSADPTPNFSAEEVANGANVVTPAFGGGTANVEFELLTGIRTASLPVGSIPYLQYVQRDIPVALPNYLKQFGYETLAIHPFDGAFWKRNEVYPHLGIDRFIDQSGFENAQYKGPFISDQSLADKILEQLDEHPGRPKFIFAASMENHGGYEDPGRYPSLPVHSLNAPHQAMQTMLDNYAAGMHDADRSLAFLAEKIRQRKRPAILVFFGDHLSIPLYMMVDAGLISSSNYDLVRPDEQRRLHTVQALMIGNHADYRWSERAFQINDMAPQILRAAGLPVNPYWHIVDALAHQMPAHIFEFTENQQGRPAYVRDTSMETYQKSLNLMTFDVLFGDQHLVKALNRGAGSSGMHPHVAAAD